MKRFFCLFLVALLCISLCVNIAFASDVVTAPVDQNILVYFPWFGGVSGSSANRVTNYATVTSSDITSASYTVSNLCSSFNSVSINGLTIVNNYPTFSATGTTGNFGGGYNLYKLIDLSCIAGHKYYFDSFAEGNFSGLFGNGAQFGSNPIVQQGIMTCVSSGAGGLYFRVNANTSYDFSVTPLVIDLTDSFGAGNEPSTVEDVKSAISAIRGTYSYFSGSISGSFSTFSLVPAPAANGGSSSHQINDYTWYQYEADISLSGEDVLNQSVSDWLDSNVNYSYWYSYIESGGIKYQYVWSYGTREFAESFYPSGVTVAYTPGDELTNMSIHASTSYRLLNVQVDPDKVPLILTNNSTAVGVYTNIRVNVNTLLDTSFNNTNEVQTITLNDPTDFLSSDRVFGDGQANYDGTFTIDRIFRTIDNSYFLFNNQVNLGTYDFNVNVKFPSLDKFNAFSGYWSASFNTSWGEIPVRTQIQEVSSNSSSLIKVYKLTFDVPFTGQYTKFNIKYIGDSSAFTTIRVDASVIDPNGYLNGAGPTTINGLSFYLTSMFDKFWGKVRSLFFDQDQTYEQVAQSSTSSELAADSAEVSEGASTIHEYETENFDSIEEQMDSLDWDIPNDFGSADDPSSAIGFISTFFGGIFLALGSKVQVLIVIPLMLGLCLLILGRGSQALGAINKLFR